MDAHATVIARVSGLAARRQYSINRLADFSGTGRGYLSPVLRGKGSPTLRTLEKLAAVLEVEVVDLLRPGAK